MPWTNFFGDLNSSSERIGLTDENWDKLFVRWTTVATDSSSWYAKWCLFIDTDVSAWTSWLYENKWTNTSSTFTVISNSWWEWVTWSLDNAYSIWTDVTVDEWASTWTDSTAWALNTFELVKDWAGSGNILDISADAAITWDAVAIDMNLGIAWNAITIDNWGTARTWDDIQVTDDSTWNHSIINVNKSWSWASVWLDYQESYNWSSASFVVKATMDNADWLDTTVLQAVRWTWIRTAPVIDINDASTWSAQIIDIDLTWVYTWNVFDFASAAAATWNVINMNLDNAVAMTWIHIEWSWVRTQPLVEIITDSTSSASLIDLSVDWAITWQAALDIDMNAWLAANAIYIDAGAWTRTANLIEILDDWDGNVDAVQITASNTWSWAVMDINVSWARTWAVMDVALSTTSTWAVFATDMDAAVWAAYATIDAGWWTRTVDLIDVTFDWDGNVWIYDINCTNTWSWNLIDVDVTWVHTWNILDLTYWTAASTWDAIKVAMWTNVTWSAINITATWARTDDIVKITSDHTNNWIMFDLDLNWAGSWNCIDVTYGTAANTWNALDLNMGTNVAWMAVSVASAGTWVTWEWSCLDIKHTWDLVAGADVVRISSTWNISSTSNLLEIVQATWAWTAWANWLYINCTWTNVEAIKVDAWTVTFDETLEVTWLVTATAWITWKIIHAGITTSSWAWAVAVTWGLHEVTTTWTWDALTLANWTAWQKLTVVYVAEWAGWDTAVLTPTTLAGWSTITFNTLWDSADLTYSSTWGWYMTGWTAAIA